MATVNDDTLIFYQDMFIYSGKWQESQVFPQVRTERQQFPPPAQSTQRGVSPGEIGDSGNTYCTLSSNTPVLPLTEKRTEAWWWERREDKRWGRRVEGISTYIQIQKNMYKSYSLQALCSHIYSCHNRQQNRSMAGPSFLDMQVEGPTMRELTNVRSDKNQQSPRGRGGWRGRGCGGGCLSGVKNQV